MQQYHYRRQGGDLGIWDARVGRTVAGTTCKVLEDLSDKFYLVHVPVQQVPSERDLAASYTSMRLYGAAEGGRFSGPYKETMRQPVLRGFIEQLQASVPRAAVRNARVQMMTTPEAAQAMHSDKYSTERVRLLHALERTGTIL